LTKKKRARPENHIHGQTGIDVDWGIELIRNAKVPDGVSELQHIPTLTNDERDSFVEEKQAVVEEEMKAVKEAMAAKGYNKTPSSSRLERSHAGDQRPFEERRLRLSVRHDLEQGKDGAVHNDT